MIVYFLQRLLAATARLAIAAAAILVLLECSVGVLGSSAVRIWSPDAFAGVPAALDPRGPDWGELLRERGAATGRVLLLALATTLLAGHAWGILGARLRRYGGARLLASPFALLACAPGFWLVGLFAVHSYHRWQRPGFAGDLVVERGPDLLVWWHAAVVALPLAAVATASQILAVARAVENEAARPWTRGLHLEGIDDEDLFYRHILRRATRGIAAGLDGAVPVLLGSLVVTEPALQYPGIGSMLVDSIRLGSHSGIFAGCLWLCAAAVVATFVREVAVGPETHAPSSLPA